MHIKLEPKALQSQADNRERGATHREHCLRDNVAAVKPAAYRLNRHPDKVFAVVHGPERGLLAAICGCEAVMNPEGAVPRKFEQFRPDDGSTVDQTQVGLQVPDLGPQGG